MKSRVFFSSCRCSWRGCQVCRGWIFLSQSGHVISATKFNNKATIPKTRNYLREFIAYIVKCLSKPRNKIFDFEALAFIYLKHLNSSISDVKISKSSTDNSYLLTSSYKTLYILEVHFEFFYQRGAAWRSEMWFYCPRSGASSCSSLIKNSKWTSSI